MVDRSFSAQGPLGSALGISGCLLAVCATPWTGARFDRSISCRNRTLEGLASSRVCFPSLCGDCNWRWLALAAHPHETNVKGALVGIDSGPLGLRIHIAVLGSFTGAALVGGNFRLSRQINESALTRGGPHRPGRRSSLAIFFGREPGRFSLADRRNDRCWACRHVGRSKIRCFDEPPRRLAAVTLCSSSLLRDDEPEVCRPQHKRRGDDPILLKISRQG